MTPARRWWPTRTTQPAKGAAARTSGSTTRERPTEAHPATTARPTPTDELDHFTCCVDTNVSLCGFDLTTTPFADFDTATCIVCDDLETGDTCPIYRTPCPEENPET